MEWNVPDYQDRSVTAYPKEDGQEGDPRRDGGRPQQTTGSVTGKEEDDDFKNVHWFVECVWNIFN